jgi:hypothetical protein
MLKPLTSLALCLASACAQAVPSALLNPDVTPATLTQTVCRAGYTKTVRPSTGFTNGIKKRLMREQAMDFEADKGSYELDHIVPLALGGHPRNLHNLTLQPCEGADSAKRKDRLEVKLQCLVCSGDVKCNLLVNLPAADGRIWNKRIGIEGATPCYIRSRFSEFWFAKIVEWKVSRGSDTA